MTVLNILSGVIVDAVGGMVLFVDRLEIYCEKLYFRLFK